MAPHRISLQSSQTTTGDVQRVLAKLEATQRDLPIIQLVANWAPGFRPFVLMADALLSKGSLRATLREIAILHIAAVRQLDYEWQEHAPMAARAGVSPEQIEALRDGSPPDGELFDEDEILAAAAVHELLEHDEFAPETWERLCDRFGQDVALEFVFIVAWWGGFVPVAVKALFPLTTQPRK